MLTAASPVHPVETARRFLGALTRSGPLVVAVSGGSDSTALLLALHEACRDDAAARRPLLAVTVDHGLRTGAADEARRVAALCAERGIAHRTMTWRGEKPSSGLQAAARMARYRLLAEAAAEAHAVGVVTAHTRDDQAETVAMRAARVESGGPSRGLAGMAPATLFACRTWILRPFLGLARADLRTWLAARGLSWIDDPSNADRRFERVRVRAAITPGDLVERIAVSRRERHECAAALAGAIGETARLHGGFIVSLAADDTARKAPVFHAAMSTLMTIAGGRVHAPAKATQARLAAFARAGGPGRMNAVGAIADFRRERLFIYRECRGIRPLRIEPGGCAIFDGRYRIDNAEGCIPLDLGVRVPGASTDEARALALADVPLGVVERALAAEPLGLPDGGGSGGAADGSRVVRHLAPFDVFLPLFDLILANRCATLFDRAPYTPPPVDR